MYEMDSAVIVEQLQSAKIVDDRDDQPKTAFAKDTPRIVRYSLADTIYQVNTGMDYHVQMMTSEDKPRVLKFLKRFFFRDEPLNYSIKLIPEGEDSTCFELEEYSLAALEDNLSLMAVSTSGAVIGVLLNGKMEPSKGDDEPEYIADCKNPKFKKILRLLHHVDKEINLAERYPGLKVVEMRIISVDNAWRGRGVARALIEKTEEFSKELGYNMIRCDCTSLFSAKLCKRFGFDQIYELKYADYLDEDGKPIFTPESPHTSITTYVKKL